MSSSATIHLDYFKLPAAVDTLIDILMSEPTQNQVFVWFEPPRPFSSDLRD
ncbi:hypothetical protein [Alkalihalobacillus sp. TS-13]|uniref:hypothetical protein n=1 Tax=Alkalihalobacillus sp. TS-13 TaxID=2842455 RepID=UPI001C8892C4|nr:hypothetical protein [Alkalihalobacillus sp. TS-13]